MTGTPTIGALLKSLGEAYEERDAAQDLLTGATNKIATCMRQLGELAPQVEASLVGPEPKPPMPQIEVEKPKEITVTSITLTAYAKARGVSPGRIYQLIRDGSLTSPAWLPGNFIVTDRADDMLAATIGPGKLRNAVIDAIANRKRANERHLS